MIHLKETSAAKSILIPLNSKENNALKKACKTYELDYKAINSQFSGKTKEVLPILLTNKTLYFLGLGEGKNAINTFRWFFYTNKKKLKGEIAIDLTKNPELVETASNGALLGNYEIGFLKTDKKEKDFYSSGQIDILVSSKKDSKKAFEKGKALAETQEKIMGLMDAPANYKTPEQMASLAKASAKEFGYKATIFDEKQCLKHNLHALLAVSKGSIENPCRFIILEYNGGGKKTIGLVGKGVTFDTGGVSLKPGDNMNYMKSDMGGAAAVLGTIEVAAKLKLPINLIAIVPATENCIDSLAIKPGDVINSYSGKTIEVINTDAEGRLILADGLAYMIDHYKPDTLIDLATLTGACVRSLGYAAAGLMTNNDNLAQELYESGQSSGEKLWRLPLWDDYKSMMDSDVADIKNLSSAPLAGATTAGKFLELFTSGHKEWAHLDIAGTAFGDTDYGKMKSGTAFGIRLLIDFLEKK